jgi:hypothetical protein
MDITKVLLLLRYFLTKSFWRGEHLEDWEKVAIYLLWDRLSVFRDPSWFAEHYQWWLAIKLLISKLGFQTRPEGPERKIVELLHQNHKIFLSPRAYLGQEFKLEEILKKINRAHRPKAPPRRWIGVGYRDHGNAREPQLDGTPPWQEVVRARLEAYAPDLGDVIRTTNVTLVIQPAEIGRTPYKVW